MITPRQNSSCEEVATQEAARTLETPQPLCVDPLRCSSQELLGRQMNALLACS
jgi:hypothetical protein